MRHSRLLYPALALTIMLAGCTPQGIQQQVTGSLQINSTTMPAGVIPDKSAGCNGPGISPQISWTEPPPRTQSLALIMDDRDAPVGHLHRHYFVHWVAFDMPADRRELTEGVSGQRLPDGTEQGRNDIGQIGYGGPCPDAGSTHHYAFTVYALDTRLGLPVDTKGPQLLKAIDGHILARGQIMGAYGK